MNTSQNGINLIKEFEGLKTDAYICPANVWTIGYGHTKGVKKGDKIDAKQAENFLKVDVISFEKYLNSKKLNLNQNQFDALVSFIFNLGSGAFETSTLFKKIKQNPNDKTIANEFAKWVNAKVNGKMQPLPGLVRRRAAESKLYFTEV